MGKQIFSLPNKDMDQLETSSLVLRENILVLETLLADLNLIVMSNYVSNEYNRSKYHSRNRFKIY